MNETKTKLLTETEIESELKTPRSLVFANWLVNRLESRATSVKESAGNHELISKLTFMMVLAMAYDTWGERVFSFISVLI